MNHDIQSAEQLFTDVLVIGSGGAALRAALEAHKAGAEVLIVVKGQHQKSGATYYSVAEIGAFNVPDGAADPNDQPEHYYNDIQNAALGMSDPRLSRILASEAQAAMRDLENYGVVFEKEDDHYLAFQACFSSKPRTHVIKNHFKPIVHALGSQVTKENIRYIERCMITDLIVRDGQCFGAFAIDQNGKFLVIRAKATILATGGASQLFAKNLYPPDITGDGYAMAYRAGAQLVNMEFMQAGISLLNPVNLFNSYMWEAFPRVTDRDGLPFIANYLPDGVTEEEVMKTKARHFPFSTRDHSRYLEISIQSEINKGHGTANGGVYLDYLQTDFAKILQDKKSDIGKMWSLAYDWYLRRNVDLYKDRLEITCSAHAINGGVRINEDAHSSVIGLFAAGEVAGGPHGADRLGGNMAVTCQVFGSRAGKAAARFSREIGGHREMKPALNAHQEFIYRIRHQRGVLKIGDLKKRLQESANRNLLIIRSEESLRQLNELIYELEDSLLSQNCSVESAKDLVRAIELKNLLDAGRMISNAALARKESRGGHYRTDFPTLDPNLSQNIIIDANRPEGCFFAKLAEL
ncbi:MAG TPA: FAD-binding protein [Bacilli bacterium]